MRLRLQHHDDSATRFSRACAILCLLLLMFSAAHTALGHSDTLLAPATSQTHSLQPLSPDTPDTCALCVALTTIVVLAVLAFAAPQRARPRAPLARAILLPVTGWHTSLFSRPPPVR